MAVNTAMRSFAFATRQRCVLPRAVLPATPFTPSMALPRRRFFASSPRYYKSELSTTPTCPDPTCSCAAMPEHLDIDYKSKMGGAFARYAEQVLMCTGKDDWSSRIEEDNGGDNLAADLKEVFGRGGTYSDPFHNISILNSSFPSSPSPRPEVQTTSVYLLPSFKYIPILPRVSFDSVHLLAQGFLLPSKLHSAHDSLSPIHKDRLTRKEQLQGMIPGVKDVEDVLVLICGHGGRDRRCGVMGPLLRGEFEEKLGGMGFDVRTEAQEVDLTADETSTIKDQTESSDKKPRARVGLISHIGGHKFAGNIIIYIPPSMKHPLAGHGIWYGRIEPKHVEGVIKETILQGKIIEDKFRGGIDPERRAIRL